jgi:protein involved in polysaccharide export with SLBB domain
VKCARAFLIEWNSRITFFRRFCFSMIGSCTCIHGDAAMQQRSLSAGLTLHILLFVFAIAGISAGVSVHASAQTPPSASSADSYILGPNDRIRLKVYGESDITGEYEIDNTGQVSIPLAGHIKAAGATTKQLEKSIASALSKGIVRDPRVNVEIAQYRPYYILGEVKKSGEYPYRHGLTVMDAVASAGGFTYRANENKVFLRRSGAGAEETYPLDAPVPVFPGDNIRIPERYF